MELGVVAATLFEWPDSVWVLIYTLGNLFAACLMVLLALYALRNRDSADAVSLMVLATGAAIWCLGTGVQVVVSSITVDRIGLQFSYSGAAIVSTGWFAFTLVFTDRGSKIVTKYTPLLAIYPIFTTVVGGTNELLGHRLFWESIFHPNTVYGISTTYGIGWYIHIIYGHIINVSGVILVAIHFFQQRNLYRSQAVTVLFAALPPLLVNIFHILMNMTLDFTPIAFSLSALLLSWSIFNYNLTDIRPIARRTAWDELEDAVVTLDEHDRVVDANEAAQDLFDAGPGYEGVPAHVFFEKVPDQILLKLADAKKTETKITTRIDGEQRHFSISISPISSEREQHGRVIVLQDITDLKQREQELDVLRQVQSRVLRHNIRTELSMVRGHAQMVAAEVDEQQQERMESIVEAGDRLAAISDKARVVEELFEDEQSPREYDVRGSVDQAVANVRAEYPELSVSVTGATECQAKASPHLQTAVENLLENAAEHNDSDQPEATIHLKNGSAKELTISDNGPGIPEQELTVLEKGSEDALEHGSGLGLWLVKWIADRSDAELEFETGQNGTKVTLKFC